VQTAASYPEVCGVGEGPDYYDFTFTEQTGISRAFRSDSLTYELAQASIIYLSFAAVYIFFFGDLFV
jgi:hypothetical protein